MNYIVIIFAGILGFVISYLLSGKKAGARGIIPSIKFQIRKHPVHIHHWLIFAVVLLILLAKGIYNAYLLAFIAGIIIQGLTYKDRFLFIYPTKTKNEI